MKLQVFQIDAWRDPDGSWTYNNSIPLRKIEINGEVTKRKIFKALRNVNLLGPESIYQIDDYFVYEGMWNVQLRNGMPLYDVSEEV